MALEDRVRGLPRRPRKEPTSKELEDAANNLIGKPMLTREYLGELTSRLYQKHGITPNPEDAARYEEAVSSTAKKYYELLSEATKIDAADRILAATTVLEWLLPVAGHVVDAAKDIIEIPFKAWHAGNHYIVGPWRRNEQVDWQRAAALAGLEAASLVPNVGSAIDFISAYTRMAEDKIISEAYARATGKEPRFDFGSYVSQFVRRPFSLPPVHSTATQPRK